LLASWVSTFPFIKKAHGWFDTGSPATTVCHVTSLAHSHRSTRRSSGPPNGCSRQATSGRERSSPPLDAGAPTHGLCLAFGDPDRPIRHDRRPATPLRRTL